MMRTVIKLTGATVGVCIGTMKTGSPQFRMAVCKISSQQAEERTTAELGESQLNDALTMCSQLQEERDEFEMLSKNLKESFEKSRKEVEARIRKLTIQRNLAVIFGLIMVLIFQCVAPSGAAFL